MYYLYNCIINYNKFTIIKNSWAKNIRDKQYYTKFVKNVKKKIKNQHLVLLGNN